jgi:hypothetical protein
MQMPDQFLHSLTAGEATAVQRRAADEQMGRLAAGLTRSLSRLRGRLTARPGRRSPGARGAIDYWYATPSGSVPWSLRYSSAARTENAANGHSSRGTSV